MVFRGFLCAGPNQVALRMGFEPAMLPDSERPCGNGGMQCAMPVMLPVLAAPPTMPSPPAGTQTGIPTMIPMPMGAHTGVMPMQSPPAGTQTGDMASSSSMNVATVGPKDGEAEEFWDPLMEALDMEFGGELEAAAKAAEAELKGMSGADVCT